MKSRLGPNGSSNPISPIGAASFWTQLAIWALSIQTSQNWSGLQPSWLFPSDDRWSRSLATYRRWDLLSFAAGLMFPFWLCGHEYRGGERTSTKKKTAKHQKRNLHPSRTSPYPCNWARGTLGSPWTPSCYLHLFSIIFMSTPYQSCPLSWMTNG